MQPSKKYKLWPIDSPYAGLDLKTDCVYFQFGIVFANRVRCSKSNASKNTLTHLKFEEKKTHIILMFYISCTYVDRASTTRTIKIAKDKSHLNNSNSYIHSYILTFFFASRPLNFLLRLDQHISCAYISIVRAASSNRRFYFFVVFCFHRSCLECELYKWAE